MRADFGGGAGATHVGRADALLGAERHGRLQGHGGLGLAELPEHERSRQLAGQRVGATRTHQGGGGAVHRLGQEGALARVQVEAGRDTEPADDGRGFVRDGVPEDVRRDQYVELLGVHHHVVRHGVHVHGVGLEPRELLGDAGEHLAPDLVAGEGVGLVHQRDALAVVGRRPDEGRADDPLDLPFGVALLDDVDRAAIAIAHVAAVRRVVAPDVFAEDDPVDVGVPDETAEPRRQRPGGAEVHVQVQPEAQPEQDVAGVTAVRNPRVADGPEQDGVVVVAQVREDRVGQGLPGVQEVLGAERQVVPVHLEVVVAAELVDDRHGQVDDLGANAVTTDGGDAIASHELSR